MTEQKKSPEISIIVPVYKVEKYLNECIDSILAQTFTDFELILVDDGSPDNCPALAAKQTGAELAVCNEVFMEEDGSLCDYQEQPLRTEVLSREEAIHRIRLTPLIQAATRLHRRDVLEGIVFPVGKNYEDAFTTPEIIEHATAVACIKEKLYHYRLHPASIMHGKVTLKNLDEIDANYGLLACALKYGKKDTAFLQYVLMKRMLRNTKKNLPPKQRNSERVQQAEACLKKAGREVRQQGACTLRNAAETALCIANPQFYFNFKYRK